MYMYTFDKCTYIRAQSCTYGQPALALTLHSTCGQPAFPLLHISSSLSTSGEITLLQGLDREEDPLIVLTISAQDNGVPSKTYVHV